MLSSDARKTSGHELCLTERCATTRSSKRELLLDCESVRAVPNLLNMKTAVTLGLHTPRLQAKFEASESKLKKLSELSSNDKDLIDKMK